MYVGALHIGTANTGAHTLNFNDDPTTSHPPDRSCTWVWDSSVRTYTNGDEENPHFVYLTDEGNGNYSWQKKDENGTPLDGGTFTPA